MFQCDRAWWELIVSSTNLTDAVTHGRLLPPLPTVIEDGGIYHAK